MWPNSEAPRPDGITAAFKVLGERVVQLEAENDGLRLYCSQRDEQARAESIRRSDLERTITRLEGAVEIRDARLEMLKGERDQAVAALDSERAS